MRRQLLLLASLICAIVIAVLLRTAAPDSESTIVADHVEPTAPVVAEFTLKDCTISTERGPRLTANDAAQPLPPSPAEAGQIAVARSADERGVTLLPTLDFEPLRAITHSSRITIRPPPAADVG